MTLDTPDWAVNAGDSAFIQGTAITDSGTYTVRLMANGEPAWGIASIVVGEGTDPSAPPVFELCGAPLTGSVLAPSGDS